MFEPDRIKGLDQLRTLKMRCDQFTGRGVSVFDLRIFPIAVRIIITRVDDDPVPKGYFGQCVELSKRDGDADNFSKPRNALDGRCPSSGPEFANKFVQSLAFPGIAECYLMPGTHE